MPDKELRQDIYRRRVREVRELVAGFVGGVDERDELLNIAAQWDRLAELAVMEEKKASGG